MKYIVRGMFLLLGAVLLLPGTSLAATFDGGDLYNLKSSEVVDDNLYLGAGDLTMNGSVLGDLYAGAGAMVISGTVRDDLVVAGGEVSVLGAVGGDVRVAAGNLLIDGVVGGDLLAAGGSVKVLDTVTVARDISLAGGYLLFDGAVAGDALLAGEEIVLDGTIAGDVEVEVGESLTLGEHAQIGGVLVYRGVTEGVLTLHEQAVIAGGVVYEARTVPQMSTSDMQKGFLTVLAALLFAKLVMVAVAAVVLVLVFRRFSQSVVAGPQEAFWVHVLRGAILFVMVPVAVVLLFMTVFGAYLALGLLVAYILLLLVAGVYSGVLLGSMLVRYAQKEIGALMWWHALLGVVLLGIIRLIPIVGWLVCLVFFLAALGSFFQLFRERVWVRRVQDTQITSSL